MTQRSTGALVIAIDGPSGSGKSTVARGVAKSLGLRYLDTGAMYRATTWLVLHRGVATSDADAVAELAGGAALEITTEPAPAQVCVEGTDVTTEIRSPAVTAAVSAVSAIGAVRAAMVRRQRDLIGAGGIVVEGRDIGTTVAPDAPVKVFLTADPDVRAQRRGAEISGGERPAADVLAATGESIRQRDAADSTRSASPLIQAPDAVVIDATALTANAVIDRVVEIAKGVIADGRPA